MTEAARIGCCGFSGAMAGYWERFRAVEVQKSFYRPPKRETAERWRGEAPAGCEFTLKAWQLITHEPSSPTYRKAGVAVDPLRSSRYGSFRDSEEVWEAWLKTREIAQVLLAKVILFQCPARFTPTQENIRNLISFFSLLKQESFRFAWEPRGEWPEETIAELCRKLDIVHCVDPFAARPLWGEFRYFRLHGIGGYRYRYTDEDLATLRTWIDKGKVCYVMFNNVFMKEDAMRFQELIES